MPAVSSRSLIAIGRPCSAPGASSRASAPSAVAAARRPSSASRVTIALSSGWTASMRLRCACMTSTQLTSRRRMAAASSVALLRHSSSLIAGILALWGASRGAAPAGCVWASRRPERLLRQLSGQLGAGAHAELAIARGEVGLDGLDAQEEGLGDLAVTLAGRGQLAHLALARRQRRGALGRRLARAQAGGHELAPGALGEQERPGPIGVGEGGAQRVARLDAPAHVR